MTPERAGAVAGRVTVYVFVCFIVLAAVAGVGAAVGLLVRVAWTAFRIGAGL